MCLYVPIMAFHTIHGMSVGADLSAFRAIPDIPLHLFICIIGPNIHQPKLLSRVSSCSPHVCHAERSEASHVRVEMLCMSY